MTRAEGKKNAFVIAFDEIPAGTYTLTIEYTSTADGSTVAEPTVLRLKSGEPYSVTVPAVTGFIPMTNNVSGIMPASDRTIAMFMIPDDENAEQARRRYGNLMEISDYGTPLGVFNSVLGTGEIIE